jgi:predicted GIY-YIG superfamily endonuclease
MNVYFLRAGNRGAIKIGIAKNVDRRIAALQAGNAFKLNLLASIPCINRKQAESLEGRLHRFFSKQRIRGEWFQGNIDFRKAENIVDFDQTCSSLTKPKSTYVPIFNARKKRKAAQERI